MSSPGDNMTQTEPEMPEEFYEECKNCLHPRYQHFYRDGCNDIHDDSDPEVGVINRCHCTNFEVKV